MEGYPEFDEPRYSPAESARLLRNVSPGTVRRWLGSVGTGPGVLARPRNTNWASFLDLVELYIALELQKQSGISTVALRERLNEASVRTRMEHPLARRSFLLEGRKLWLPTDEGVVDLGEHWQLGLEVVVRSVARNIDFDANELAERWWPQGREAGVVIDPRVAFGDPIVAETRINTDVLYDLWEAEDHDLDLVAEAYALQAKQVQGAIEFERLRRAA